MIWIMARIKLLTMIAAFITAVIGSAVAWTQNNLFIPASRAYVIAQIKEPTKRLIEIQIYQATESKRAIEREMEEKQEILSRQQNEETKKIIRDKIRDLKYQAEQADSDIRSFRLEKDLLK